jgi:HlyD family secretion protein
MSPYPFLIGIIIVTLTCLGCQHTPVIHARRKDLIETVYASGKITPAKEYSQSALCTGTIVRKLIRDGDTVKKGQLLYLVGNTSAREKAASSAKNYAIAEENLSPQSPHLADLALALRNAQIRLTGDSLTYHRWKTLWAGNIGTRDNLDNCYNKLLISQNEMKIAVQRYSSTLNDLLVSRNNARTQAAQAQKELDDYSIRSDKDGIVYQTFKESGESVHTNEVVALLGERGRPQIRLAVDQQDIGKVQVGQTVLVQTDATGSAIFEATIGKVYPVMNELDQTFRADAWFTAAAAPPFIHSSVEANIIVQKRSKVLVLPHSAILAGDSVTIFVNGRKRRLPVKTGITTPEEVEIISGITETTEVIPPVTNSQP